MNIILSFLTFLEIAAALLIIVVVLMQRSKSGGGLGAISGGVTEEVFGAGAGNFLSKTTVGLSLFFLINTLLIVMLQGSITRDKNVSVVDSVTEVNAEAIENASESDEESTVVPSISVEDEGKSADSADNTDQVQDAADKESDEASSASNGSQAASPTENIDKNVLEVTPIESDGDASSQENENPLDQEQKSTPAEE